MSITTEIQRINSGKQAIRTLASQKNVNIPSTALIDSYASVLGAQWPDCTFNVNYDGDKIRGKTMKWNQNINVVPKTIAGLTVTYVNGKIKLNGTATAEYPEIGRKYNAIQGHKYLVYSEHSSGNVEGSFRLNLYNSLRLTPAIGTISLETSFASAEQPLATVCTPNVTTLQDYEFVCFVIDLTKNDLGDITSTSDPRASFLIQYAKDHPDYDTGSLVYSFYKGTKLGEYDYIDTANNKLVLGGAEVDISQMSLTRFLFGSNYLFYGTNNDQETNTTNVISADYQTAANITDIPDMSVTGNGGTGKTLWFRDDSCTTVEQFKAKNAGKKVYFKLATPTEIDL